MNRFTKTEQNKLMSDCPRIFKKMARKFKSEEHLEDLDQQAFELMLVLLKHYRNLQSLQDFFKLYKASSFYLFNKKNRRLKREKNAMDDYKYILFEHFEASLNKRFSKNEGDDT